tara:strand:+ start:120 stop:1199 length:1080 start_codon:yes stop_codon:yes gene_type:complete
MNYKEIFPTLLAMATLSLAGSSLTCVAEETPSAKVLQKIIFGSCASEKKPQPIWDTIVAEKPDLFLFIGDNIYGDTEDMAVMREKYQTLGAKPGYQKLLNTCPVLSTWDDHDYGKNDGGSEYPMRDESAKEFLDFFKVPKDSPRRARAGIYGAKTFGKEGQRVQVILLDTRYFRSAKMVKDTRSKEEKKAQNVVGWYVPHTDTSTTLLGAAQWAWLEQQLQQPADVRIIASSVQVVSREKGMECWGNFPHERQRLIELIRKTKANGVVCISGDVHFSELSVEKSGAYPLYDLTSSGLTNSARSWSKAVNNLRVGKAYAKNNFGVINIDWASKSLSLEILSLSGTSEIKKDLSFSELMMK